MIKIMIRLSLRPALPKFFTPVLFLAILLASNFAWSQFRGREVPDLEYFGRPQVVENSKVPEGRLIKRLAYEEYYCPQYEISLWVAYAYRPTGYTTKRSNRFTEDPEFDEEPELFPSMASYRGVYRRDTQKRLVGFDKGHQAPDSSIKVYGREAQDETYYLSNMTPQYSVTNQGIWREWEAKIRAWAGEQSPVWVFTGPVFYADKPVRTSKRGSKVAVPHAYFCVLARGNLEQPEVLAFLVKNTVQSMKWRNDGRSQVVKVSEIERLTGFDFLSKIAQPVQGQLESKIASLWESPLQVYPDTAELQPRP